MALKLSEPKYKSKLSDKKSDIFARCVELFRPVYKSIKKMNSKGPHSSDSLKYLIKLGDHITLHIISLMKKYSLLLLI